MTDRRRSRRNRGGRRGTWWILGVTVLAVIGAFGVGLDTGSVAFTSSLSERGASVDVADDTGGLLGLDTAASVEAGTTSRLITVTNQVGQPVDATATLDGTAGTLSNSQGSLQPGDSLVVVIDVPCGSGAETITVTVSAAADDRFSGSATRSTTVDSAACGEAEPGLSFVDQVTQNLKTVADDGTVTTYDTIGVAATGPSGADLNGDGDADVPYVDENDNLAFVDSDNDSETLDSSGDVTEAPLGVGDYDNSGTPEVYYVRNGNLHKGESGAGTSRVVDGKNWDVGAVAGVADFDSDDALEVVFTIDKANRLVYLDDTGRLVGVTGKTGKVDELTAISTLGDFDGDGEIEVAGYDGDDEGIDLYDASGRDGSVDPSDGVEETPMGTLDYDDDGVPEVVYLDENRGVLRALDATGGTTVQVKDSSGDTLDGDTSVGVQ